MLPRPPIPEATEVLGAETLVGRQNGLLRRFTFPLLKTYFAPPLIKELLPITLTETAKLALAAQVRTLTFTLDGVLAKDLVVLSPLAPIPAGYMLGTPCAKADKTLDVPVYIPAMIINASYTIKARVFVIRP